MIQKDFRKRKADRKESYEEIKTFTDKFDDHGTDAAGMPMTAFAKPDWPSDTGIESEAGIVMDADSGAVLFGQNIHVQKAPASITKILTRS